MINKGWIKLHRSLVDWEWYSDINARLLLLHLLVSVNYEDKKWKGILVKSGSIVLSWHTLSKSIGLSVQQCRTAMSKLIDSEEVTKSSTSQYQVISLVKWDKLQYLKHEDNNQANIRSTSDQQAINKRSTTTKETNNIINKEIKNKEGGKKAKRFSAPTIEDLEIYFLEKTNNLEFSKKHSQRFYHHYESKNWMIGKNKMANWKSAVSGWINRQSEFEKEKSSGKKEKVAASTAWQDYVNKPLNN